MKTTNMLTHNKKKILPRTSEAKPKPQSESNRTEPKLVKSAKNAEKCKTHCENVNFH